MFLGITIASAVRMFRWTPTENVPWWIGSQLTVIMPWDQMQPYMIPACTLAVSMASSHCALHGLNLMLESLHSVFAIPTTSTTATATTTIHPTTNEKNGKKTKPPSPSLGLLWKLGFAFQRLTGDALLTLVVVSWIYLSAIPLQSVCDTSSFIPKYVNTLYQETQGTTS